MLALAVRRAGLDAALDIQQQGRHHFGAVSALGTHKMGASVLEKVTTGRFGLPMPQPHVVFLLNPNHATGFTKLYCHFDGYLEGVGFELMQVYNTFDRAKALVEAGDMSSPGDPYSKRGEDWQTIAPHRYGSYESYLKNIERDVHTNGYSYLFKDGKWLAHGRYEGLTETPHLRLLCRVLW